MNECYCTECDWEGQWDELNADANGNEVCPECGSKLIEAIYEDHDDNEDDNDFDHDGDAFGEDNDDDFDEDCDDDDDEEE